MAKSNTNWGQVILIVLAIVGSVAGATHLVDSEIGALDRRVTKVEGAVKYLGDQQSDGTKQVIHDLLAAAVEQLPSKPAMAKRAIDSASSLLTVMKKEQGPADEAYFRDTVTVINALATKAEQAKATAIGPSLFGVRLQLAEYRSSIEPPPSLPTEVKNLNAPTGSPFTSDLLQGKAVYRISFSLTTYPGVKLFSDGAVIDASSIVSGDILKFSLTPPGREGQGPSVVMISSVEGLILKGASQTLDNGISWKNVIFLNVHVKYTGGPLQLDNVRFVNCTFEAPTTDRGATFVDYAALQSSQLTIS